MNTQKSIEQKTQNHWKSPLLNDIGFIKKYLRYPIGKRTASRIMWIVFSLVIFVLLFTMVLILNNSMPRKFDFTRRNALSILPFLLIIFVFSTNILRQLRELKFIAIKTDFFLLENIKLLKAFFDAQNLAHFHHPDAPEVFQISSRVLDRKYDLREIMVFIADDKRILLNSHFVSSWGDKGKRSASMKENRKMAKTLKRFMEAHRQEYHGYFSVKAIGK